MSSYKYVIAITDSSDNVVFYIEDVEQDRFGNYYPVIALNIDDAKIFSNVKICKEICDNLVGIIPEYNASYFRIDYQHY